MRGINTKLMLVLVLSIGFLLSAVCIYFGTRMPRSWSIALSFASSVTALLGLILEDRWESIKILFSKYKLKAAFITVILICWLFLLFTYAIPTLNIAFSGFKESDNPLIGVINCVNKNGDHYSFSMESPNTKGTSQPTKRNFTMLILTRRPDESLVMTTPKGEQVEVIVLGVKGNQVRLGIVADKSINIVRSELLDDEVA